MKNKNAVSFILFILACVIAFIAFMLMTGCIYPHELRKEIIEPTYDDWETGYAETSPLIIMAQEDDWDDKAVQKCDFTYLSEDTCEHVFMVTSNGIYRCIKCYKTQVGIVSSQRTKREFMTVDSVDYSPYDPIIKLSDLIAYERECYNDSTQVTEHVNTGMNCLYMLTGFPDIDEDAKCQNERHYDHQVWRHKQPTFTGFIAWLQKKQK